MRTARLCLALLLLLVVAVERVNAQEGGDAGLVIGYPSTVGVIWHLSDSVAMRPEFGFSTSSIELESIAGSSDGWSVEAGASALFYIGRWGNVRSYLSPRFVWNRVGTTIEVPVLGRRTTTGNSYETAGSFGVQYRGGDRFGIFGEAGVAFTRLALSGDRANKAWGSRTAAGVVFYF